MRCTTIRFSCARHTRRFNCYGMRSVLRFAENRFGKTIVKVFKIIGIAVGLTVLVTAIVYFTRTDPIAIISGKRLSGDEAPYPSDWAFSNAFMTIAVESRTEDPHSVTTLGIVHEGELSIPAQSGSTKTWPQYVLADPRVRIKVGDTVYPARAERVVDVPLADIVASAARKYPRVADRDSADAPQDVWLFRFSPRR